MKTIGIDITVLNDDRPTGIAVYVQELLRNLLEINRKDRFILFGFSTLQTERRLKNLEFRKYPNVEIKVFKMPAKFFRTIFKIWQKTEWPLIEYFTGRVDIYHSFNFYLPPQKIGKRIATIFDLTSILFPQYHLRRISDLDKIRFDRIAKQADLVVAISRSAKEDFIRYYHTPRVEVVYPAAQGVFDKGIDSVTVSRILKKYRLQPGYFLSVATLEPRKNLETLIDAYDKNNFTEPLVLVGRIGWKTDRLLKRLNGRRNIIFTDFVPKEDLVSLYKGALCFIYPSYYEGFGIPVLEAMKSEIPVICSDTSSFPEVGGNAVYYFNPNSKKELIKALSEVESSRKLRAQLVKRGVEQAKKFNWQRSAEQLNSLYQKI